uniref:RE1-silencing transcription factor A n=1 Tax=Cacopsylla melanoneura TaxID=428564 RepID=A0A8D8SNX5_9HEMI
MVSLIPFYLYFPEPASSYLYSCHHCTLYKTYSLKEIVAHSKECNYMIRMDSFSSKYVCFMCDYRTYCEALITAHICSHSGEKPFKCRYCSFASARNNHVLTHMKSQHQVTNNQFYRKRHSSK